MKTRDVLKGVALAVLAAACSDDQSGPSPRVAGEFPDVEYSVRASKEFHSGHLIAIDGAKLAATDLAEGDGREVRFLATDGKAHSLAILDSRDARQVELVIKPSFCNSERFDIERQQFDVVEDETPPRIVLGCTECQEGDIVAQQCFQYR